MVILEWASLGDPHFVSRHVYPAILSRGAGLGFLHDCKVAAQLSKNEVCSPTVLCGGSCDMTRLQQDTFPPLDVATQLVSSLSSSIEQQAA